MVVSVDGDSVDRHRYRVNYLLKELFNCLDHSLLFNRVDKLEFLFTCRAVHIGSYSTHDSSAGATAGLHWQRDGDVVRPRGSTERRSD